jgi:hypothetical protein
MKFHISVNLDASIQQQEATCTTDAVIHYQSTAHYLRTEDQ